MSRRRVPHAAGPNMPSDVRDRPLFDETALVFALRSAAGVRAAAARFLAGEKGSGPVDRVLAYIAEHRERGADLTPLFSSEETEVAKGAGWRLALSDSRRTAGLPHAYMLQLAEPEHGAAMDAILKRNPAVEYIHRPAIFYPLLSTRSSPLALDATAEPLAHQWGLKQCGFHHIWSRLDLPPDPDAPAARPIGMIDMGGDTKHPDLHGRVRYVDPPGGSPSKSGHAAAVAAVMAALRGNGDETGMAGCCSAEVCVYNAWDEKKYQPDALYKALEAAATNRLPVLNMSLTSFASDATADRLIRRCLYNGVVVVAAMGDYARSGNAHSYPANNPDVIAVGGTDRYDRKTRHSSTGPHIWISAPGEDIQTVSADRRYTEEDGTSFAAAMVTAAVWLARRADPNLLPTGVRDLLAESADRKRVGNRSHSMEVGYGRLDMEKLADIVAGKQN